MPNRRLVTAPDDSGGPVSYTTKRQTNYRDDCPLHRVLRGVYLKRPPSPDNHFTRAEHGSCWSASILKVRTGPEPRDSWGEPGEYDLSTCPRCDGIPASSTIHCRYEYIWWEIITGEYFVSFFRHFLLCEGLEKDVIDDVASTHKHTNTQTTAINLNQCVITEARLPCLNPLILPHSTIHPPRL